MKVKVEKAPIYTYLFNKKSAGWSNDPTSNLFFLTMQQNYVNEKLRHQGYIFLNEVLDAIGIRRTKIGQVVGWIYDENNTIGDNFVDFGLGTSCRRRGVNGAIPLRFNVDGNILNRM